VRVQRYVCIHGHFYQPPRENPWLEAIELQDSAYPYHDWNERIDAECYAPNSASRILDPEGRIARIVNNYASISYNFGPTLLAWMKEKSPETYRRVLDADEESVREFAGHGSALAQCYNHMIMPLANQRDKYTQVRWGIRDFEARFGRRPEGMWLPETAVDIQTLDILAENGILFTILAPHQARRERQKRQKWRDVSGARIDPTMAYKLRLPSRRATTIFFYDGPISRAVAFENLLDRGENLAGRLIGAFSDARPRSQLVHIATDGETYGHHHHYGEMALSYALQYIQEKQLAKLTNYGEFLSLQPPVCEVQIHEDTSWSCVHGIERWRSDCGCNTGGQPGWNQQWRQPLREALDWLRDEAVVFFEQRACELLRDPWAARDDYIDVILDRSAEVRASFFNRHATRTLEERERITALNLFELQRHAMLMYTSCGWFFSELSGIETVQVIQYAGRVIQLAKHLGGPDLEPGFLDRLERAKSNIPEHGDGRRIYEKFVRTAMVDLEKVGVHYAVSSIFENGSQTGRIYSYSVERQDYRLLTAGKARLAIGKAKITSEITLDSAELTFAAAHLGDQNVTGAVRQYRDEALYTAAVQELSSVFLQGDFAQLIRVADREFEPGTYSLARLFRDEQRKIVRQILGSSLAAAEAAYRQIYENHVTLMRFLAGIGMPAPKSLEVAAEVTLNSDLREELEKDDLDFGRISALVEEDRVAKVPFDAPTLEFTIRKTLERLAERLANKPADLSLLEKLDAAVGMAIGLPFQVVLWRIQNTYHGLMLSAYGEFRALAGKGDRDGSAWVERFRALGTKLSVRVE
jgi:alpha-amylase/alpha-mannosidase (GH57 family)